MHQELLTSSTTATLALELRPKPQIGSRLKAVVPVFPSGNLADEYLA